MYVKGEEVTYRLMSKDKLICFSDRFNLFSKGNYIYAQDIYSREIYDIGRIPLTKVKDMINRSRIMMRLARLEPRCGVFINSYQAVISGYGNIYLVDIINKRIEQEHKYRSYMSNPLSFTKVEDIEGFDDCILYGDYINDGRKSEIAIYQRLFYKRGWKVIYTFPMGRIKHIHTIIPCKERKCLYVLTGDSDEEFGIWEIRDCFRSVDLVIGGKQRYRTCVALPTEGGIIYATDAPDEENAVWFYSFLDKKETKIENIAGPCIYGKIHNDKELFFSTSVEPDGTIKGLRSWITYKRGRGVIDNKSHIYKIDSAWNVQELFTGVKDFWPMKLFGYGTFQFSAGEGKIIVSGQAIKHFCGKSISFEDL